MSACAFTKYVAVWNHRVAERISYVWRINYFYRWSRHIFSPNGDDESHSARMTFPGKSNSVKARQTRSSSGSYEQDGCLSVRSLLSSNITPRGEPSDSWTLGSTLIDPGFPGEHELDKHIHLTL